jgi:microcystin-dependent protein
MAATIINPTTFRRANSTVFNYIMEDSQHINDLTLNELYLNTMNIHLGTGTGNFLKNQGTGAIAIGAYAGSDDQGAYSIAVGAYAGNSNQPSNSIVINATSNVLNNSTGGFFVKPINRNDNYVDYQNLGYNPSSGEIIYSYPIPGVINIYAGSSAPQGTLLCDGSAVSRTTYSRLYLAIGTTYGIGNGTGTFNLPNLQGRVPVGLKATEPLFSALGNTGGTGAHTLSESEMPSHTHTGTTDATSTNSTLTNNGVTSGVGTADVATGSVLHSHTFTTNSTGGGLAHNNLQPYIVLNYIISY